MLNDLSLLGEMEMEFCGVEKKRSCWWPLLDQCLPK
jgi:hypothetical protein